MTTKKEWTKVVGKIAVASLLPFVLALAAFPNSAGAAIVSLAEVPTSTMRLENYQGVNPAIVLRRFPTPGTTTWPNSACTALSLPEVTQAEQNRLFNLILVAKITGTKIFLWYDTTACTINSFGMDDVQ